MGLFFSYLILVAVLVAIYSKSPYVLPKLFFVTAKKYPCPNLGKGIFIFVCLFYPYPKIDKGIVRAVKKLNF